MSWLRRLLHVLFRPIRMRECGRTARRRAGSAIAVLSQINVASHDCLPLRARVTYATCIHSYIRTSQAPWPRLSVAHRAASGERRLGLWIAGTSRSASGRRRIRRIIRAVLLSRPNRHALSSPVPRRIARPASGLGRRRPAGEIEEARPRMGRPLAVQPGKNPVVHGQRPKGLLSRFLFGQARQHLRFRHGERGRDVPGGGGAARLTRRRPGPQALQGSRSARGAPQDAPRRARARGEILRIDPRVAGRRQGARLSRRSRDRARRPTQIPARLCGSRALCAQGASRRPPHSGSGHDRGRAADRRRSTASAIA